MAIARASIGTKWPARVGSTALVVAMLRDLGMPWVEIDAILETDDPRLVRRYLQLHGERLEENLAEQRAALMSIEPILAAYRSPSDNPGWTSRALRPRGRNRGPPL